MTIKNRPMCLLGLLVVSWIFLIQGMGEEELSHTLSLEGKQIEVTGQVCKVEKKESNQIIYLKNPSDHPFIEKHFKNSKIFIHTQSKQEIEIGNQIKVKGMCQYPKKPTNPGQFNIESYYKVQGISLMLYKSTVEVLPGKNHGIKQEMEKCKVYLKGRLKLLLGESQGSVMAAMLLGEKEELDLEIKSLFQVAGIAHILAISGLHISLIGLGIYQLIKRIAGGFLLPCTLSSSFLITYGIFTGMPVSAKRAIIMFCVYLGAQMLGRTYDLLSSLMFACILILLKEPAYLYYVGFQLSALALLGIGFLLPFLQEAYSSRFLKGITGTIGIQIMTLPCTLYWFGEFAVGGVVLNLLVLPLVGIAMISAFIGSILGGISIGAGILAVAPCHYILSFYEILCRKYEEISVGFGIWGSPSFFKIFLYYSILGAGVMFLYKIKNHLGLKTRRIYWGVLIFICTFLLYIKVPRDFNITFLDVGQGDGIFWETDTGITFLCDGGSSTVKQLGMYRMEPFLKWKGVKKLDFLMITHMDEDHINGIRELLTSHIGGIAVGHLLLPDIQAQDKAYEEIEQLAKDKKIPITYLKKGDVLKAGNLKVTCLWPVKDTNVEKNMKNEFSMVLHLEYGDFKILLTGDLEGTGEEAMLRQGNISKVNVLKVAHHGSAGATSAGLLEKVLPEVAVLSYGERNLYGHPKPELLMRLKNQTCRIYETAKCGAITVRSDGKEYWVKKYQ